ncbi:MAG: response regulator [Hyphomicrobiales bacterium]|nr:response regulator [Hyphomicrobiales bacterium]
MTGTDAPALPGDEADHILLVDDDSRIRDLASRYLATQGFRVTSAANTQEARRLLDHFAFDLIILDVMLPGESGLAFARWLRGQAPPQSALPVLMLTARGEPADRVKGLEAGVDDYMAKPFDPRELALRIAAILRRARPLTLPTRLVSVTFGDLTFNIERGELRRGEELIKLSERERDMLRQLCAAPDGTLSRDELASGVTDQTERVIDVQVNRLRRKIEADPANPHYLQTVRGTGYRLVMDGEVMRTDQARP